MRATPPLENGIEITRWRQLYDQLPEKFKKPEIKKGLRKKFSRFVRLDSQNGQRMHRLSIHMVGTGYYRVEWKYSEGITIHTIQMLPHTMPFGLNLSWFQKGKVRLERVTFTKTGKTIHLANNKNPKKLTLLRATGEFLYVTLRTYKDVLALGIDDVIEHGEHTDLLKRKIPKNFPDHFRYIPQRKAHGENVWLCVKDGIGFHRGQIIDFNMLYNYNQHPKELFRNPYSVKLIGDLSLTTREELTALGDKEYVCKKRKFGCPLNCVDECLARQFKKNSQTIRDTLLELYDQLQT